MKTQISRDSHRPDQRFSAVLQQMGRMLTDADWNESATINRDRMADALIDVVGSGTPRGRGLVHEIDNGDGTHSYELHWGYLYAEGVEAQVRPAIGAALADPNAVLFEYGHQADFPAAPALPAGPYQLYADVWERAVTALEDQALRDPGLHGADTCTRSQTMAQIKWCATGLDPCDPAVNPTIGNARLTLSLRAASTDPDPCDPCADEIALHDDVGNYLFRVEIHDVAYAADGSPERIVLKWSVENGAEQYVIGEFPPGFSAPDWCYEFFHGAAQQFASEKHLGRHLAAGFVPARGTLTSGYPDPVAAGYANVRRWDGYCELSKIAGSWVIGTGSDRGVVLSTGIAAEGHGHGHVTGGATVVFMLNTVRMEIDLDDHAALAGDYWLAPVRQAVNNNGDVLLDHAPPRGIRHHYLCLGSVDGDGAFTPDPGAVCKAFNFPPLTDLRADDVCYDNGACEMPGVKTVQDALDHLCREHDLRWHNKHLHGWGIVCGLIVECGEDDVPVDEDDPPCREILITSGYALDCEGNDIVLKDNLTIDLIDEIDALRESGMDGLPPVDGAGSVCLVLDRDDKGKPTVKVEAYSGDKQGIKQWLDGTLLMDVYEHCIKGLIDAFTKEFRFLSEAELDVVETAEGSLVSKQRREQISIINLIVQLFNPGNGRYVYLSHKEHLILRDLYLRLRELLKSKTFCGMFESENFPDYPFRDRGATTWFGKNGHTKIVVHPDGNRFYTYAGVDSTINVYDLGSGEMVEEITMPSGVASVITAVAVDARNDALYVAALSGGVDTVFGRAKIGRPHVWDRTAVLCDLEITAMEVIEREPGVVYAIGRGRGLYALRPDVLFGEVKPTPNLIHPFRAFGHLAIDSSTSEAYATAIAPATVGDSRYDRIAVMSLIDGAAAPQLFALTARDRTRFGTDGLALKPGDDGRLYVVVDPVAGETSKLVLGYSRPLKDEVPEPDEDEAVEDSSIALAYHAATDSLLLAVEDGYRLQSLTDDADVTKILRIPAQIQPIALAVDQKSGQVYALNFISNTVTSIPANELDVTPDYLTKLEQYRTAVLQAFYGLAGGLLQYLKDCFCHHMLIRCPTCDDAKIYLACVEIRDNGVYRICNFGKRKYVHSFPTVEYWLSLVPVLPILKGLISNFCCMVLPDLFGKYRDVVIAPAPAAGPTPKNRFGAKQSRQAYQTTQRFAGSGAWQQQMGKLNLYGRFVKDQVLNVGTVKGVSSQAFAGAPVDEAVSQLQERELRVNVLDYDESQASRYLSRAAATPQAFQRGSRVNLYQKDGRVVFAALTDVSAPEAMSELHGDLDEFAARKQELGRFDDVEAKLKAISEQREAVTRMVDDTGKELATLESSRAAAKSEMVEIQSQLTELRQGLDEMAKMRTALRKDIAQERPVATLSSVTPAIDESLRAANIRSIGDLAAASQADLTAGRRMTAAQARSLISAAKDHLAAIE